MNDLDKYLEAYEGNIQYDFDNEILLNWYPRRILEFSKTTDSLLELGLGHGYSSNIFSNFFRRHVVLEGSHAIIKNFQNKYPGCTSEIVETFFEDFNNDEKFDVVVMGFILEHVNDPVEILMHFRKYLTPVNGNMFISVPNAEVLNRRLGHIAGMLPDILTMSENDVLLGHKRYYTIDTLKKDIKEAGYEIIRIEGIYLKPFTSKQILSLDLDNRILNALCIVGIDYPELSCGILVQIKPIL